MHPKRKPPVVPKQVRIIINGNQETGLYKERTRTGSKDPKGPYRVDDPEYLKRLGRGNNPKKHKP